MDYYATGEIHHTPTHEQSFRMPRHVCQRTVYHEKEEHHEEQVGREPHALCEGACYERRCDDGELHLEQSIERQRYGRAAEHVACRSGVNGSSHAVEHGEGQRRANHAPYIIAETQGETNHHPQNRYQSHCDERLQHRGDDVLRSDHASIKE